MAGRTQRCPVPQIGTGRIRRFYVKRPEGVYPDTTIAGGVDIKALCGPGDDGGRGNQMAENGKGKFRQGAVCMAHALMMEKLHLSFF
jgi:hypothetical protein